MLGTLVADQVTTTLPTRATAFSGVLRLKSNPQRVKVGLGEVTASAFCLRSNHPKLSSTLFSELVQIQVCEMTTLRRKSEIQLLIGSCCERIQVSKQQEGLNESQREAPMNRQVPTSIGVW